MASDSPSKKKPKAEDRAESSGVNITAETNMSFHLTATSQAKLKQVLDVLCSISFNPNGLARLQVTEKGFEIIVRNFTTTVAARLFLKPSELINFHCHEPIVDVKICLYDVSRILFDAAEDNDAVGIFHPSNNSTVLVLEYGSNKEHVTMSRVTDHIPNFPDIKVSCKGIFASKLLRQIINHTREIFVTAGKISPVKVTISKYQVNLRAGERDWSHPFTRTEEIFGDKETPPGDKSSHIAWFDLPHWYALTQVSGLVPQFLISFLIQPPAGVLMEFYLRELGDLEILTKLWNPNH